MRGKGTGGRRRCWSFATVVGVTKVVTLIEVVSELLLLVAVIVATSNNISNSEGSSSKRSGVEVAARAFSGMTATRIIIFLVHCDSNRINRSRSGSSSNSSKSQRSSSSTPGNDGNKINYVCENVLRCQFSITSAENFAMHKHQSVHSTH